MGRKPINEKDKSKMRPVSLKDKEVEHIKEIGNGSLTGGVKEMMSMSRTVLNHFDCDFQTAQVKLIILLEKSE